MGLDNTQTTAPDLLQWPASDRNFDKLVREARVPVFVYFWASWSVPSRTVARMLEDLQDELERTFALVSVDIDDCPRLVARLEVASIPLVILYDGQRAARRKQGGAARDVRSWATSMLA